MCGTNGCTSRRILICWGWKEHCRKYNWLIGFYCYKACRERWGVSRHWIILPSCITVVQLLVCWHILTFVHYSRHAVMLRMSTAHHLCLWHTVTMLSHFYMYYFKLSFQFLGQVQTTIEIKLTFLPFPICGFPSWRITISLRLWSGRLSFYQSTDILFRLDFDSTSAAKIWFWICLVSWPSLVSPGLRFLMKDFRGFLKGGLSNKVLQHFFSPLQET